MFNGENEVFAVRVHELESLVSQFFVFEGECDHRGNPKKLLWDDRLITNYTDRVDYVIVPCDGMQDTDAWVNEKSQREFAKTHILEHGHHDDETLLILADLDEIPRADILRKVLSNATWVQQFQDPDFVIGFEAAFYYYNVRCMFPNGWTLGPKMAGIGFLHKHDFTDIRHYNVQRTLSNGAWHFSYFMTTTKIARKLKMFTHTELDKPQFQEPGYINDRIKNCLDLFGRSPDAVYQEDITDIPQYMITHADDLPSYFYGSA